MKTCAMDQLTGGSWGAGWGRFRGESATGVGSNGVANTNTTASGASPLEIRACEFGEFLYSAVWNLSNH